MPLLVLSISLIGFSLLSFLLIATTEARARSARRRRAREELRRIGLNVDGDPLASFTLSGRFENMDIRLDSSSRIHLPGPSGRERTVSLVSCPGSTGDLLVCKREDQDDILGVLPDASQVHVGESAFHQRYGVFVGADTQTTSASFREGAIPDAVAWMSPGVVQQLLSLDLQWARLQNGLCQLAFAPIDFTSANSLLLVAANIASGGGGRAGAFQAAEKATAKGQRGSPMIPFGVGAAIALLGGLPATAIVKFVPWLRDLNADDICGKGNTILVINYGDGYGLVCSNDWGRSLALHEWSCALFFIALVLLLATVVALIHWLSPSPDR